MSALPTSKNRHTCTHALDLYTSGTRNQPGIKIFIATNKYIGGFK